MGIPDRYIPRLAEDLVARYTRGNPVLAVVGPRQSGKTTLVRRAFPDHGYVNLEDPVARDLAVSDPARFMATLSKFSIIDEIQRAPELLSFIQVKVDEEKQMGQFILTGSAQLSLAAGVSQSLAGRVAFVNLLPLSHAELREGQTAPTTLEEALLWGGYPPVYDRELDVPQWYRDYIATYLERDVRQIVQIAKHDSFRRFLGLCAGNTGGLLNLTRVGADAGVATNTAREWMNILEQTFVVKRIRPHHENFRKRLVKTPKLYFVDTGVACALLGITTPEELLTHPLRGALFENYAVMEVLKSRLNAGHGDRLYFWRDNSGREIDLLLDEGGKLHPVEIKSGMTVASDWFGGLRSFVELAGERAGTPRLVYGGKYAMTRDGVELLPWNELDQI